MDAMDTRAVRAYYSGTESPNDKAENADFWFRFGENAMDTMDSIDTLDSPSYHSKLNIDLQEAGHYSLIAVGDISYLYLKRSPWPFLLLIQVRK